MTDSDTPVPRRALGVAGSADEDPAVDTPHRPSRAIWPSDPDDDDDWDDDEPVTLTGLRGILPEPAQSTPVPPPAPVLPSSVTASQQSAYRPRFSAVSSTSPAEPPAPRLPDPPVVAAASRQATPEATTADLETGRPEPTSAGRSFWADRRQRMVALVVIGVAVLALIAALVATSWNRPTGTASPTGSGSPSTASATPAAELLTVADLSGVGKGVTWAAAAAGTAAPTALCLTAATDPAPASQTSQAFTGSAAGSTVIQAHARYADAEAAKAGYAATAALLGGCLSDGVLITDGYTVSGLADEAVAVTASVQDAQPVIHTLLLTRTGTSVELVDASQPKSAFAPDAVAAALAKALGRGCTQSAGTCPTTVKVTAAAPPSAGIAGWLTPSDLPRVTLGTGRWGATEPAKPTLVGSQCENVDLNQPSGADELAHRTYLLADDAAAPSGFGVDEAIYTFAKASDASALVKKLTSNINGCRTRTKTATVKKLDAVSVALPAGGKATAASYDIVQRISDSKSVQFRVGYVAVGTRVVYLLANPSAKFDFTDAQWSDILGRAIQRVTQLT